MDNQIIKLIWICRMISFIKLQMVKIKYTGYAHEDDITWMPTQWLEI